MPLSETGNPKLITDLYFYPMINAHELRLGNYLLQKQNNKITTVPLAYQHFELLAKGEAATLYPVVLKPELFEKCGFTENKDYPLLPAAREFILVLPVSGSGKNEIYGYLKTNKECFARAVVEGVPASNPVYHLHQLQNLYFALTGQELAIK